MTKLFLKISTSIAVFALLSMIAITGCGSTGQGNIESQVFDDSLSTIPQYESRFDREKPVIAVIGENSMTELTDYVVPWAILTEADIADVYALSTKEGPIQMFPALTIQPQETIADFDTKYAEGADYVIVPAVHETNDPDLLNWITEQAEKGATIIGVCDGVWVLANAGLLDGKKAVGHWFSFKKLAKKFPETQWVRNHRYLADENIITTTGVTASVPVSLALVEAISGNQKAAEVAVSMGVLSWDTEHNSDEFKLNGSKIVTAAKNWLAFWSKEDIGIPVYEGVDEIALALHADALSRTFRSKAYSMSENDAAVRSNRGLLILPDKVENESDKIDRLLPLKDIEPVKALDYALHDIEEFYGKRTAEFVALQLEYEF